MTTELSTSIPMATMNAPRDMRCSVVPRCSSIGNDSATVRTRPRPMIIPLRHPIAKTRRTMTMSTDSSRLIMNDDMASLTLSGWKNIFSTSIPAGKRCMTSAMRRSIALPTSGTMALFSRVMVNVSAGSPFTKKIFPAGVA